MKDFPDIVCRQIFYSSLVNPFTRFLNALGYALVGGVGAMFCLQGTLSIGQLSSLLAYATQYAKPFNDITSVITEIQNALAAASRVFDFFGRRGDDAKGGDKGTTKACGRMLGAFRIVFLIHEGAKADSRFEPFRTIRTKYCYCWPHRMRKNNLN